MPAAWCKVYFLAIAMSFWHVSDEKDAVHFPRLANLADCAKICASVLSMNPEPVCELTDINLWYIRGSVPNGILPLIGASTNVSEVCTQVPGNINIAPLFPGPAIILFRSRG